MRVGVIVNPAARAGSARSVAPRVAGLLRDAGATVNVVSPADAEGTAEAVRRLAALSPDAIMLAGGDGTAGLALAELRGGNVPLGLIPTGTGNDLARTVGLHELDAEAAAAAVLRGRPRSLDLARATDAEGRQAFFTTVLACGFDSRVNDRANRMRWPRGPLRYSVAILIEFLALRTVPFDIHLTRPDGTVHHVREDLLVAAVGNTRSYGGGIPICPHATPDDGLLDVTLVRSAGRLRLLALLRKVYAGSHVGEPEVSTYRVRSVTLRAPGVTGYADGEPMGLLPLRIDVQPAAVSVFSAAEPLR